MNSVNPDQLEQFYLDLHCSLKVSLYIIVYAQSGVDFDRLYMPWKHICVLLYTAEIFM